MLRNLLFFSFILTCNALQCQDWNLVWEDEFDGNSLNSDNWSHDLGTGAAQGLWGWGNGELQYYQPENTSINGGTLTIEAQEEPEGISDFYSGNQPYYYSSSKITTRDKFEFTQGRIEARIKTIDGEGFWPAFWMLPADGCWPENGEIDIMEQWGNDGNSNVTTGAAHVGNCGDGSSTYSVGTQTISSGSYADEFHTYSVVWYDDYIGWYVDDVLFHSVTPSTYPPGFIWPFNDSSWYLIINLAITSSGPNNNTTFPNQIEVDWVRVYQTNDILGCTEEGASNYNPDATLEDGNCVYPVTFNVNMNCTDINFDQVYITGPFTNWCGNCFPLSDQNNDDIWTGTFQFPAGDVEYKYEVDNWSHQENLIDDMLNGETCAPVTDYANYANRLVNVSVNQVFDSYGSCANCEAIISGCTDMAAINYNQNATQDDGSCDYEGCIDSNANNFDPNATVDNQSCMYTVEFNVDMACSNESFSVVYITGPFTDWCGDCFPLSDPDQDNIWSASYEFPAGDLEYKYEVDNWNSQENLIDDMINGGSCAPVTDFANWANRLIQVSETPSTNDTYGSCESCPELEEGCTNSQASNYNAAAEIDNGTCEFEVTFVLDMSNYTGTFLIPEVNGTWNGWCGGCNSLTDLNEDNIWEGTFLVPEGTHEFKFAVDNWNDQEELADGDECTLTTGEFINRILEVNSSFTYGEVCWENCESCQVQGCTSAMFIEYNPMATADDGSCLTLRVYGCTYIEAENYNPQANTDDLSCLFAAESCPGDFNEDGFITSSDLTQFLSVFGGPCN